MDELEWNKSLALIILKTIIIIGTVPFEDNVIVMTVIVSMGAYIALHQPVPIGIIMITDTTTTSTETKADRITALRVDERDRHVRFLPFCFFVRGWDELAEKILTLIVALDIPFSMKAKYTRTRSV